MRNIVVALVAGMTLILSACGANQTAANPPADAASATPAAMDHSAMPGMGAPAANAPYDALFIDGMIVHHQGAITMATQALKEASRPEIKTLAANIIASQAAEITQMQSWRRTWYPAVAQTQGTGMAMGDMQISGDASTPFDRRFIEAMIPHHEGALAMAKDAQQKAEHAEIKQLAGQIITAQEAEIIQMRQWLKDWYSR